MKKLKLGVIGMSEGNGHPYSWSAIFNGYDKDVMADCPFPVIPEYLSKEKYPNNFLSEFAEVTHVWTQDKSITEHIASAARIGVVCIKLEEMIGQVDAVLLARDDAENHYKHAHLFLKEGLPIYIDKPFALNSEAASQLWSKMKYENQIFTCSALQFAYEFQKDKINGERIGNIEAVWATIPKSWNKYAVHLIEPVLNLLPERGELKSVFPLPITTDHIKGIQVEWTSGILAQFQTTGNLPTPLVIRVLGNKGYQELHFQNSFYAFRESLKRFIEVVNGTKPNIPKSFTKEMVKILEGINNA